MSNNSGLADFELTNCRGNLAWNDNLLEVNFKLLCGRDGSLLVSCDPIPRSPQSGKFLTDRDSPRSRTVQRYILTGLGTDGVHIETKYAYVEKLIIRPNFIDLEMAIPYLELVWQSTETDAFQEFIDLQYYIPGLECLESIEVETPFGKVGVGATKVQDYTELTGIITITARRNQNSPEATQLKEIDSAVRRLLDVLSLAEGRFMEWSIRYTFSGDQIRSGVFRGPKHSSEPRYPLFSFLNLQPVVKMAVEQYTEELRKATGLDVAIKWFLIRSQYTEIQCLTLMTALEHLIHVFRKRHPIPQKQIFKKVRLLLQDALNNFFKDLSPDILSESGDAQEVMSKKLDSLNQRTLRSNLETLLEDYQVPMLDDIKAEIPSLIKFRNRVVHQGYHSESAGSELRLYYLAVLRELLTRVFLSLLKYKGAYQSFLNGHQESRQFSPD